MHENKNRCSSRTTMDATRGIEAAEAVTRARLRVILTFLAVTAGNIGCTQQIVADPSMELGAGATADRSVIVGGVDWQEATSLPEGSAERQNSKAVAFLSLPTRGSRCTGFLIAPNVLMTNEHCVPSAAAARGAQAWFRYEAGIAEEEAPVDCSTYLGSDSTLDYALLRCAGRPGDTFGVLGLADSTVTSGAAIYVVHQNCDYMSDTGCAPTKKYSPGRVMTIGAEIAHDADTLGGSSGSPLFSRLTHNVVGLHHAGVGNDGRGRGSFNRAVPMSAILAVLRVRHPGLELGARTPAADDNAAPGTPAPAPTPTDGYEPNDALAAATPVPVPFQSVAASVDADDRDHYVVVTDGAARRIRLRLSHAVGDLDMMVLNSSGSELARSEGTGDIEEIAQAFPAGQIVVRVVGYQGARGPYVLEIE